MNLGENIKNAFNIVQKTYENVDKLMSFCDSIASDCGYESVTDKFLRYRSDPDYGGWYIDSFIKLYQSKKDKILRNEWKNGPVYVMEINFEDIPTVYLSKFKYKNMSEWDKGVSPTEHWGFSEPIDCQGNGFNETKLEEKDGYFISTPETEIIKSKYWDIERVVYTSIDLLQLNSNNIAEKIFSKFDALVNL